MAGERPGILCSVENQIDSKIKGPLSRIETRGINNLRPEIEHEVGLFKIMSKLLAIYLHADDKKI
jgi:hypothetical protein